MSNDMDTSINVNHLIDNSKLKPFHYSVFLWCYFIIVVDGYDVMINGVVLPLLMKEWNLTTSQMGLLTSMTMVGMMFGAMIMGMIADRVGRKISIIICVIIFSGFTCLGGFADSPIELAILRFIAGLGIGGVLPNLTALTSEFAPKNVKSTFVTIMLSGSAVGSVLAVLIGQIVIPEHGWRMMFYLAGIPLIFLPFMFKFIPESLTYLVKNNEMDKARNTIRNIDQNITIDDTTTLILTEEKAQKASYKELFIKNRALPTVLFGFGMFMALLMLYALGSWVPKLMINAGYSMSAGLNFLLVLCIGAVLGNILGGILADKVGIKPVIVGIFLMGAITLYLLSFDLSISIIYVLLGFAGASASAAGMLLYSYVAQFYPLEVRSTGIGWTSAIGRVGAITGPIILGVILGMDLSTTMNFIIIAIPALIGAILIAMIKTK